MPTPNTIIGRYPTTQQFDDFLQLIDRSGANVLGGIDGHGFRYGTLAAGNIIGVETKTANYTATASDNGFLISFNSASPSTLTLPATAPTSPWVVWIQNVGAGTLTVNPNSLQLDASTSSVTLPTGSGLVVFSNGSAYFTERGTGGTGTGFNGVSAKTTDYTALPGDTGKLLTFTKSTAVTLTLPATAPGTTWFTYVQNTGAGALTVSRNGLTIDGAASNLTLLQNQGVLIFSDGTNYFTDRGVSGVGAVNAQTTNYTLTAGDSGKLVTFSNAGAITGTLPATAPAPGWFVMIENTGAGTLTVSRNGLNIDGAASNLSISQNQGLVVYSDGANYFTQRGTGAANAAIKPAQATGIQFVAVATGSDSNDGYSWGTAKLTIMAAYDALPASGGTIFIAGPGVDATQWPAATATSGQGIWIMGPTDPNYSSPPAGWRKAKNGGIGQVAFIGVPSSLAGLNGMAGNCAGFLGGDNTNPAIWLSDVSGLTFRNLGTQYPKSFAWLSINSNGIKNDNAGGSALIFDNCTCNTNNGPDATKGPVVDIGPNLFWVRFTNCSLQANASAPSTTKNRAAIYIDEGQPPDATITATALTGNIATYTCANNFAASGIARATVTGTTNGSGIFNIVQRLILTATPTQFTVALTHTDVGSAADSGTATVSRNEASGILYFENCHFTGGGGINYQNLHEGTAGHWVHNCSAEGTGNSDPLYAVYSNVGVFRATLFFTDGISDTGTAPPKVYVAPGMKPYAVTVFGLSGFNNMDLSGPLTYFGQAGLDAITTGRTQLNVTRLGITSPQAQNQKASVYAKTLDQGDWARRMFGLTLARFTNLADQNPANWVTHGSSTITTGVAAPDGTTNAATVSGTDPTGDLAAAGPGGSITFRAGDYLYFGVWMKITPPAFDSIQSPGPGIWFPFGDPGINGRLVCGSYNVSTPSGFLQCPYTVQDDGAWQWVWGVLKCTTETGSASPGQWVALPCAATGDTQAHKATYYNPIMCRIPATSVQTVANSTIASSGTPGAAQQALTLTQVAVSGGLATYTGTITGGGSNALVGQQFTVSGFANAANNVALTVTASTATTLVCLATTQVNETHAGTANGHIVTITTTGSHGLIPGMLVCIKNVTVSGYNGEFAVQTAPSSTTFTVSNPTVALASSGSGTVVPGSDSEVAEWAMNAASYSNVLTAGPVVATPTNVPLAFGGTGDRFFATLDHTALTANRTILAPDAGGTMALTGAANSWSALQSFASLKSGASGATITQIALYTPTLTPASVAANTSAEQLFTVSGVVSTDVVIAISGPTPTAGTGIVNVRVSNTNQVAITFANVTAGALTPVSGTYPLVVMSHS